MNTGNGIDNNNSTQHDGTQMIGIRGPLGGLHWGIFCRKQLA